MNVDPTDKVGSDTFEGATLEITQLPLDWRPQTPNASCVGRRRMDTGAVRRDIVDDVSRLAIRHDFRRQPQS